MEVRWMIRRAQVPGMNNATCNNVADDGTLYIMSDSTLYSISPDGEVRWAVTNSHQDIFWPSEIVINGDTIEVCYDSGNNPDYYTTIVYDLNGNELYTSTRPILDGGMG